MYSYFVPEETKVFGGMVLSAALLLALIAVEVRADTVVMDGIRYEDVEVMEGSSMYYVRIPATDKVINIPKSRVENGEVVIISPSQPRTPETPNVLPDESPGPEVGSAPTREVETRGIEEGANILSPTELTVRIMLLGSDLSLTPVPRHELELVPIGASESGAISIVTTFSGEMTLAVAPGEYRLSSRDEVEFAGEAFRWDIEFSAGQGATSIELSNDNATTRKLATPAPVAIPAARAPTAADVYEAVSGGVATLETEIGQGTAFLVDERGLFLTNDHVVSGSRSFILTFNDRTRYVANLIYSDPVADIAVLRVNPIAAEQMTSLKLASDTPESPALVTGENVFAIGSPLHQSNIITSGIASKIEDGAIISDVLIDHGNSGGPLLNSQGEVVGINTFGEGRGIGGSIRIWKAFAVLEQAKSRLSTATIPTAEMLPPYPDQFFPVDALRRIVLSDTFDLAAYTIRRRKFDVLVLTPPALCYFQHQDRIEAAKGREKRRKRKKVKAEDLYDPVADLRDWNQFAGGYRATVQVLILPKAKATFGSAFSAGLLGAPGLTRYRFRTDFDRATLYRGDKEVPFIRQKRTLNEVNMQTTAGHMEDVAHGGYIEYLPEAFKPPLSLAEVVYLEIVNETKPDKTSDPIISRALLERVWSDFAILRVPAESVGQL